MKKRTHTLSSSDEEPVKKKKRKTDDVPSASDEPVRKKKQKTLNETPAESDECGLLGDILENSKVAKFNFKSLKFCDTLYFDDVSDDDEIWLVQAPKHTNLTSSKGVKLNTDTVVSQVRCRINGAREKVTAYSIEDFPSQINLALPHRPTKSFQIKVAPIVGQLILQKNIKITKTDQFQHDETEDCIVNKGMENIKSERDSNDERKSKRFR